MFKKLLFSLSLGTLCIHLTVSSHCQMPCGIYHDAMVYDQIDQYIETMAKGITVVSDNKFANLHDRNEFVRWIMEKESASDEVAYLIMTYFMQQKIKPNEDDTVKRLVSAHKLLSYLVSIKQTADLKFLNDFYEEWEKFKTMFHIEGYACKMEQIKLKKWAEKEKKLKSEGKVDDKSQSTDDHDHDHEHDHDHDHTH